MRWVIPVQQQVSLQLCSLLSPLPLPFALWTLTFVGLEVLITRLCDMEGHCAHVVLRVGLAHTAV